MTPHDPKTCETALDWIESAVRGELGADASSRLAAHLSECDACRAAEADALAVRAALKGVVTPPCPDHVVARIHAATGTAPALRPRERTQPGILERVAGWLAGAMWRPVVATATAVLAIVVLTNRLPEPSTPEVAGRSAASHEVFCNEDIDAILATLDLGDLDETEARRAAEEACLAFEILARAMNRAAGAAEREMMESLGAPLRRGIGSGLDRLPAPLQRPQDVPLDRRG